MTHTNLFIREEQEFVDQFGVGDSVMLTKYHVCRPHDKETLSNFNFSQSVIDKGVTIAVVAEEETAKLIAEAFNVANETGKTPKQLADENKELLDTLHLISLSDEEGCSKMDLDTLDDYEKQLHYVAAKAEQAIKKATK